MFASQQRNQGGSTARIGSRVVTGRAQPETQATAHASSASFGLSPLPAGRRQRCPSFPNLQFRFLGVVEANLPKMLTEVSLQRESRTAGWLAGATRILPCGRWPARRDVRRGHPNSVSRVMSFTVEQSMKNISPQQQRWAYAPPDLRWAMVVLSLLSRGSAALLAPTWLARCCLRLDACLSGQCVSPYLKK